MDVNSAINDFSHFKETLETLDIEDMDPRNFGVPGSRFFSWFIAYFLIKLIFRLTYGPKIWDETSLLHNLLSVVVGLHDLYYWQIEESSTCQSLSARPSLAIGIQLIHCLTDFLVFFKEMIAQPIFIWHHAILGLTAVIFPYCPGCYHFVTAYTLGEAGSASIAIDFWWRQAGGESRGFKRVVVFGLSRVLNLYLLYRIYLVTPSTTFFTLSSDGEEVFTFNFPICMITSIGGSFMMLLVNGVTWYRMFKVYVKNRKKRSRRKSKKKTA